jgi:hypothetical protein
MNTGFPSFAGILRRVAVSVAMATYLALTMGVSLPSAPQKDFSRPFPCMDRACGCRDAAQCWKGCCCFSDHEKLAWAAAHQIEVPAFVVRRAVATAAKIGRNGDSEPSTACCTHETTAPTNEHAPRHSKSHVDASMWGRCHGFDLAGGVMWDVAPPPPAVGWQFEPTTIGHVCPPLDRDSAAKSPPPLPPPRSMAS